MKNFLSALQIIIIAYGGMVLGASQMGLPAKIVLLGAGVATIILYLLTKGKAPLFLGVSLSYVVLIRAVGAELPLSNLVFGFIVSSVVYFLTSIIIQGIGFHNITRYFPPVLISSVIILSGLTLLPRALWDIKTDYLVASLTILALVFFSIRKQTRPYSIFFGILLGTIGALLRGGIDLEMMVAAPYFSLPDFTFPAFDLKALWLILPGVVAPLVDHIGQVFAVSQVVERDIFIEPGLNKTLMANGVANLLVGLFGSPPVTPYGQVTGSLALIEEKKTQPILIAGIFALIISLFDKITALFSTLPVAVMGGLTMIALGLVVVLGLKVVVVGDVDFTKPKNLLIPAVVIGFGMGGDVLQLGAVSIPTLAMATLVGFVLNLIFILVEK